MNDKTQLITMLRDEFNRWEELLAGLSEAQITTPLIPATANLPIKDVMVHLKAWQQRTIARMEAGLLNQEPDFPQWPAGLDPEAEDADQINAWIYETHHDQAWESVHREWQAGFLQLIDLTKAVPEQDLLDAKKYPWLNGYALADMLQGTYEHHEEHLEQLVEWLNTKTTG